MNLKQEILKDLEGVNLRLVKYYKESKYQKRFKPEFRQQEVWVYTHSSDLGYCITEAEFNNKESWGYTKEMIIEEAKSTRVRHNKAKVALLRTQALEAILHPTPKINGIDILHRHVGHRIIFEGWKGKDHLGKGISFDRRYILQAYEDNEEFYSKNVGILEEITK